MKSNIKQWQLKDELQYVTKSIWNSFNPLSWPFHMKIAAGLYVINNLADNSEAVSNGGEIANQPFTVITRPTPYNAQKFSDNINAICKPLIFAKNIFLDDSKKLVKTLAHACQMAVGYFPSVTEINKTRLDNSEFARTYSITFQNENMKNELLSTFNTSCKFNEMESEKMLDSNCHSLKGIFEILIHHMLNSIDGCRFLEYIFDVKLSGTMEYENFE